jgi:transcriptional regulator with XRE-family HTH domain
MDKFTPWLLTELNNRSWRPADLARRAGLATGSLSNILNGNRRVGPEMCKAIAQALGEPPEKVFRLAGLLPPLPAAEDERLYELIETFKCLTPEKRQEVLDYARWQLQRQQKEP